MLRPQQGFGEISWLSELHAEKEQKLQDGTECRESITEHPDQLSEPRCDTANNKGMKAE